jgi:hypothetical protein
MNYKPITQELSKNINVFKGLLSGLTEEEYVWKPNPNKWCMLEIICHLYDEEREDFRTRTKLVLETPEEALPPIDPTGWVQERRYMEQNFDDKLNAFLKEREQSIDWLQSLQSPNWDNAYNHPKFGPMTAKMFLSNWLAHDYLHIRQITRLKYDHLGTITGENLNYAGSWI